MFTSVIAVILVAAAGSTLLGGTTSLLLIVFTIVDIAVQVLRRRPVEHEPFRAPSWAPGLGIAPCGFLVTPLSGRPVGEYPSPESCRRWVRCYGSSSTSW
ncbi:hypothetical protein [Pseudonocardia abyssalis]|uniref:Uncharacterized protein n=1 Tax=Pseudonocardia abyssalis TaxID=2792008 RepID=A0ABS6UWW2_9PSEU|nr:hypothetical protein [Pseudonocardia abyssalis]MBW0116829.1 hypothetical protein [Pseudonocardia abyssalis]MBW0136750.1 hypothetical protein [Pseudonocardia abyssalis]